MGQVEYTPKQQRVIDTRNSNLLVSAAAGSGKTAVLTSRILSLISDKENPIDIDHMLIVTFTKAAAAEMRERIGKLIEKYLEEHPEDENMQKQHTLLHNAQITTIDSFCLYVIKNNFSDIDLDPGFRPMDEGEGQLMKLDILNEILEEHYERMGKGEDAEFAHLVDCYSEQGNDNELVKQILNIYHLAMSNPFPEDWLKECVEDYEIHSLDELYGLKWWQEGMKLSELLLQEAYHQAERGVEICQTQGGPLAYVSALQTQKDYAKMLLDTNDYTARFHILQKMEIPAFGRVSKKDQVEEELKAKAAECRDQAKKLFADLRGKFYIYPPKKLLDYHRYIGRAAKEIALLAAEFAKRFQEKKRQLSLIDFSDMEHFALQILLQKDKDGNVRPTDTAKEYQEYFAQVMVDEYQDSNYVQEYILKSVSNGTDYFMVGDVKQSIYRFRLAKPEIFLGKYDAFEEDGENIRIDLNQNFRCRKEVIHCVNEVFEQIMIPPIAGMAYDEKAKLYLGASYPERKDSICDTELLLLDPADADNSEKKSGRKSESEFNSESEETEETEDKASGQEAEAKLIADKIRSLFENHMEITDKKTGQLRPLRYQDIVILVRAAGKFAEEIRKCLETNGIPVYLSAKSGYFEAQEIRTIMNYLSIIDNPRQDIPLYGSLTSFFGGLTEEEMTILRSGHQKECLWDTVLNFMESKKENERAEIWEIKCKLERFLEQRTQYRDMSVYTTIHDLLRIIFDESGYLNYMTALPGGLRRQANLYMLLEKAAVFEQSSYHGLFQFIRYIGQLKEQEVDYGEAGVLDENADVVRIMTIHKSKGLEFPVCIIAGLGKKLNKKDASKTILADAAMGLGLDYINSVRRRKMSGSKKKIMAEIILREGLAEEMRVLYVAMTRAKEKLIMTGTCKNAEVVIDNLPEKIETGKLLRANSYLELILTGLKAAGTLQKYVKIVTLQDIAGKEAEREIKEMYYEAFLDNEAAKNTELYKKLVNQMEFSYAYSDLKGLYTKTTVSELKKAAYEDAEAKSIFGEEKTEAYIPNFAKEEKEQVTGARRGTAYHRLMELIPFEVLQEEKNPVIFLQNVLKEKTESGYISQEDAALIDLGKCSVFLQTDMAKHMCEAARRKLLYKEKSFFLGVPAKEINESFPEEEYILVQGVIDAYYEEDDGIVIIDYKTDQVRKPDELIGKYQKQLDIYARAVSQITGKKVKAKKIYSFVLQQEIVLT